MPRTTPPRPPVRPTLLGKTDPRVLDRLPRVHGRPQHPTFNSAV